MNNNNGGFFHGGGGFGGRGRGGGRGKSGGNNFGNQRNHGGGSKGGRNSGRGRGRGGRGHSNNSRSATGIEGNLISQCGCQRNNCQKFHNVSRFADIHVSNNAGINAVACLGAEGLIVCAGSDGTISFYNAEYNRVNYLNTGGSRVTYMTEATFMGKSLLFWSMDHFDPALGGEHVGVIQMIDVANLSTDPPRVTLMRNENDMPFTHPQSIFKFIVISGEADLNIISSGAEGNIHTWNFNNYTANFDHVHCFEGHVRGVSGLAFIDNQAHLWSSSIDYTLKVWSLETNTLIKTISAGEGGHSSPVTCLAKSEDNRFVVSGGADNLLIVFDATNATECYKGNQGSIVSTVSCVTAGENVILLIGLDNGNAIFRTSADVFFTAILFDNNHMAHSNALRQILPIPSSNDGYEYLSCGDDGRVLHINSSLFN